jgi:Domain of unknown function (DUF1902)
MSQPVYSVVVEAQWDNEAKLWVATSDDVPGLTAEHSDFAELEKMVVELVPMLLVENGMLPSAGVDYDIPVHIVAQANSRHRALAAA